VRPILDQTLKLLHRTPFFGPALDCGFREHWDTASEILPGLFWSMLPIWVGTFVAFVKGTTYNGAALHTAFSGNIQGG
jgi:hypothetical protein